MDFVSSGELRAQLADLVDLYRYRSEYSSAVGCNFPACLLLAASLEVALVAELIGEGVEVKGEWTFNEVLENAKHHGMLPHDTFPAEVQALSPQLPKLSVILEDSTWPSQKFYDRTVPDCDEICITNLRNFVNSVFSHLFSRLADKMGGTLGASQDRLGAVLQGYLEELCRSEEKFGT